MCSIPSVLGCTFFSWNSSSLKLRQILQSEPSYNCCGSGLRSWVLAGRICDCFCHSLGALLTWAPCTLYSWSRGFWTTLVDSHFSDWYKHGLYGSSSQGHVPPIRCPGWDKQVLLLALSMLHTLVMLRLEPFGSLLYAECSGKRLC